MQEFLPGEEYSIDVLADAGGHVIASVPRLRARVDSGVSVGGRTVRDTELSSFGRAVAEATGITYVANVQCKRDAGGRPALLEVNPRMPGTLGLTIASGVDMPRLALAALRGRAGAHARWASASAPWSASSTSASSIRPTSPASGLTSAEPPREPPVRPGRGA